MSVFWIGDAKDIDEAMGVWYQRRAKPAPLPTPNETEADRKLSCRFRIGERVKASERAVARGILRESDRGTVQFETSDGLVVVRKDGSMAAHRYAVVFWERDRS